MALSLHRAGLGRSGLGTPELSELAMEAEMGRQKHADSPVHIDVARFLRLLEQLAVLPAGRDKSRRRDGDGGVSRRRSIDEGPDTGDGRSQRIELLKNTSGA